MIKMPFVKTTLFVVALLASSCMKIPDHNPDYGPEIHVNEVQSAVDSLLVVDPMTIAVGEYVNYTVYQQIDLQTVQVIGQVSWTVTQKNELADRFQFRVAERIEDRTTDPPQRTDREIVLELAKATQNVQMISPYKLSSVKDSVTDVVRLSTHHMGTYNKIQVADENQRVTYHNLTTETGFMPIPVAVREDEHCGGLRRCDVDLRSMTVSFDEVLWTSESRGDKITYKITVSPDVPYLSYRLRNCWQEYISFAGREIGRTVCREATSFRFGQN